MWKAKAKAATRPSVRNHPTLSPLSPKFDARGSLVSPFPPVSMRSFQPFFWFLRQVLFLVHQFPRFFFWFTLRCFLVSCTKPTIQTPYIFVGDVSIWRSMLVCTGDTDCKAIKHLSGKLQAVHLVQVEPVSTLCTFAPQWLARTRPVQWFGVCQASKVELGRKRLKVSNRGVAMACKQMLPLRGVPGFKCQRYLRGRGMICARAQRYLRDGFDMGPPQLFHEWKWGSPSSMSGMTIEKPRFKGICCCAVEGLMAIERGLEVG